MSLVLSSCGSTKHDLTRVIVANDSASTHVTQEAKGDKTYEHKTINRDSAIGIAAQETDDTFDHFMLQPAIDFKGDTVERVFTNQSKTLTSTVKVLKNGNVVVRCKADSLTLVIKGLIRDSVQMSQKYDSLRIATTIVNHSKEESTEEKKVIRQSFLQFIWPWALGLLVVGAIVLIIKYKFF